MTFTNRSYEKELLDKDDIPFEDIKQNIKELNFINTWLGGHKITIDGFRKLAKNKQSITVCEIGCGGGDNLLALDKWCRKNNVKVSLIGIDMKPECITFAEGRKQFIGSVKWITSDYAKVHFLLKPDIIFSSLFCHHFTDDELVFQFKWMKENSTLGFFINDLQRHPLAFYSIKILTTFFSKSYLVKNDAPLSVRRGFTKKELKILLDKVGITQFDLQWKWAFRFLVVVKN